MIEAGAKMPQFSLADQSGEEKTYADLAGPKGLVLFTYSRDNTSGCTAESTEFQERLARYEKLGFGVAGLSRDSVPSHRKFAAKLGLGYPILSDPETGLLQDLGAWGSKKVQGEVKSGPVRSTVVADEKGRVVRSYTKVKPKGHAQAVLEELGG